MLHLRQYQKDSIEGLRQAFREGHQHIVLSAATGAGKSIIAMTMLDSAIKKGSRVMFICDRRVLVDQFSRHLDRHTIDHGIYMSGHWRSRPDANVQVASIQTLERMGAWPKVDFVMVDECFPAGTKIATPRGDVDIDLVRCGDTIYNQQGVGVVKAVVAKRSADLYRLEFSDGSHVECTGSHKFFTESGWVQAEKLEVGSYFFSIEGMRVLWQAVHSLDQEGQGNQRSDFSLLREDLEYATHLLRILCEETEQPDEQSSSTAESESKAQRDKAQTYSSWRQRAVAALGSACIAARSGGGMGVGVRGSNKSGAQERHLSELLQAGHRKSRNDDRHRVGWAESCRNLQKNAGQEEDGSSCFPRLVGISRVECEGARTVFDLQVSGHPSYFANGKLVHNCHAVMRKSLKTFLEKHKDIKVCGLTATPFHADMGKYFTHITNVITMKELVDQGFLVPFRVFVAKEIDMTGVKVTAGEWQKDEAEKRGLQIVGDVVSDYIRISHDVFGGPKKTICFSSGVAHGAELVRKFAEVGINAVQISYKDTEEYKEEVLKDFAKPDTDIQMVISSDILTRGFDQTDVEHVIIAKPLRKAFSMHVQMVGRGARPHDGKKFCVLQDHSGNWLRFQEDWDKLYENGANSLESDVDTKTRKEKTTEQKEAAKCPKCGALWPRGSDSCMSCGHTRERRSMVEAVPGEMQELTTKGKHSMDEKQKFWSMCVHKMQVSGWNRGRCAHLYKDKYGVWPKGLHDVPLTPDFAFEKFNKSRVIAYLKGKKRA